MAETNVFTAVNDTLTIPLSGPKGSILGASTAALQSGGAAVNAGAVVVLEISFNETDWITPVRMRNPVGDAVADSLTGPNKAGIADASGAKKARLRCTVLPAGNVPVTLEERHR